PPGVALVRPVRARHLQTLRGFPIGQDAGRRRPAPRRGPAGGIMLFCDRLDAGRALAARLDAYRNRPDVLGLALPRGGVPVACEVARRLGAPLGVFVVRKLGVPGHEELAMGAIASGGVRVLNEDLVAGLGVPEEVIADVEARERVELE